MVETLSQNVPFRAHTFLEFHHKTEETFQLKKKKIYFEY